MNKMQNFNKDFRRALGSFPTGVTVVTTMDKNNKPIGFTANSFTSVSLNPHLILICIGKNSSNIQSFTQAEYFAISILSHNQRQISITFANPSDDRFAEVKWEKKETGSPIISDSVAWFDCKKKQSIDAGDHIILIGQVLNFAASTNIPLVFLQGNYVNPDLGQKALQAMEDKTARVLVGALIECGGNIFLIRQENKDFLEFPTASKFGSIGEKNSLQDKLQQIGIHVTDYYLFSVFESVKDKINFIFYRIKLKTKPEIKQGKFYPFAEIPFERLSYDWGKTMLKRYISERKSDSFGIYVGGESGGKVETIK